MYSDTCSCCELPDLADNGQDWDDIYTHIANQLLSGEDLDTEAVYTKTAKQLIAALNKGFGGASFDDEDSRKVLQNKFVQNIQQFSYAKTLTQFKLFKDAMFNDKGQVQGFAAVKKIVADTGEIFNNNYLRAEHQFVTQTAIMANKWETLDAEYLEFSTVGDSHVRLSHKLFDKFTAPKSDPIWKRLYTPLDWGCRCTIIPGVVKNVSKEYDSKWANKAVDPLVKGTIFDNNAALTGKIFTKAHPYFKADKSESKTSKSSALKSVPKALKDYEKELGITVNKEIFKYLKKETALHFDEPDGYKKHNGAYYHPTGNFVKIPIDERRKLSKWYAQAVVHHEYGHAIDFQTNLRKSSRIKSLMNEARKLYSATEMKEIYNKSWKQMIGTDRDTSEKHGAILDTIASLRPTINMKQTHDNAYWKKEGFKEAEFIAHIAENKFSGNSAFQEAMPLLYKKMVDFEFD